MVNKLPTVGGYTIDSRLKEFRKVEFSSDGPAIEFVPFNSEKGQKLLEIAKAEEWESFLEAIR